MQAAVIDEMSGSQLLDHVETLAAQKQRCEVEILRAAAQHAYLNGPDTLDPPAQVEEPGRERSVRIGGEGTPEITEFASAELGGRLGISTWSARELVADGLDLMHRLPQLWGRVERLEVQPYLARLVARKTRQLTPEQATYVDGRIAECADGRLTWTRFQSRLEALVKAADPETAAAAERKAVEEQIARATQSDEHGMRGFYIRAPFATVAVFEAALERIAAILADLGDSESRDRRRVKALLILARPDLGLTSSRVTRRGAIARPIRPSCRPTSSYPATSPRSTGAPCFPRWWSPCTSTVATTPPASLGSTATAPSRRPGSATTFPGTLAFRSGPSSTSRARRPWTPTRSPTDIDGPSRS